MLTNVV